MADADADMVLSNVSGYQFELAPTLAAASDALEPGGAFYLWHGDADAARVRTACASMGWEIRQGLVWEAGPPGPGVEADYVGCHRTCVYGWKEGGPHQWFSDRKQTTVVELEGVAGAPGARDMPVGVLAYLISNSCPPGGSILDPFAGDGAAVVAAERTGRRCYLAAANPAAADVIRRRWAEFVHGPGCDWTAATLEAEEAGHAD
jgi:site-specific DNA-methyltransferase (adenine-specific)